MSFLSKIKGVVSNTPPRLGIWLAYLPFDIRLGNKYTSFKKNSEVKPEKKYIFNGMYKLVSHAAEHIPFYKYHYEKVGFDYRKLKYFEDLVEIPIINKSDLQKFSLEERKVAFKKGIKTNTGGTSGQPLDLILDSNAYSQEWAHMHTIWQGLGYKTSSIKLTLRGMNLGSHPIKYNFIHNEFQINAYCDFKLVVESLTKLVARYKIEYIHGYPSAIYEFAKALSERQPSLVKSLRKNLKGIFLGSEYPVPIYREFAEKVFGVPSISWFGHTEMAVLAREVSQKLVYHPFHSYGYAESVEIDDKKHLLGTTLHNYVSPLIRYDTGDLISPVSFNDGVLESFKVTEGRIGEFVIDNNGRSISLTALIFGRHHKLFEVADFVQVQQKKPGNLVVIVTTEFKDMNYDKLFDSSGVSMNIEFKVVNQPYKTKSGKVSLLVKDI